jgi:hypothetical protein
MDDRAVAMIAIVRRRLMPIHGEFNETSADIARNLAMAPTAVDFARNCVGFEVERLKRLFGLRALLDLRSCLPASKE